MYKKLICAVMVAVACLAPVALSAHHSKAVFDSSEEVVLSGTVRTMEWMNPHVWIRLSVPDGAGSTVEWGVETGNPQNLGRRGWSRSTFKEGDEVSITVNPAKNGRPFGDFVRATLSDGSTLSVSAEPDQEGQTEE